MRITDIGWAATRRVLTVPSIAGLPHPREVALSERESTAVVDIGPRDAPTLILLHAVGCTGRLNWYPALSALAERYRVVTFDQRWHGQGIRAGEFTLESCAHDVLRIADALGIERFTMAGYSMGGMVGQLVARSDPDRVGGLVLCSTGANFRRGIRQRAALTVFGQTMQRLREQARLGVQRRSITGQPDDQLKDHQWALAEFRTTSTWAIATAINEIGRFDSTAWLRGIRAPTAVVVTANDRFIAATHQRWIGKQVPGATSYEITAGHAACVLAADHFVPALLAACASVHAR